MLHSVRSFLLYVVNVIFGFIEVLIAIRFVLKLFAANPSSAFVSFIYDNTQGLIHPFEGAFPTPALRGGFIIEFSSLLALVVYGVVAYLLILVFSRPLSSEKVPPPETSK